MPRLDQRKRSLAAASLGLFLLLAGACSNDGVGPTRDLARARQRWASNGPAAYEFTYEVSCFCGPDYTRAKLIRVAAGQVTSVRFADTGAEVPAAVAATAPTVERLFDEIARAVRDGAQRVDVQYDERYGYPLTAAIDGSTQIADDEYWFWISSLHPL
jgi:hypothetical protein